MSIKFRPWKCLICGMVEPKHKHLTLPEHMYLVHEGGAEKDAQDISEIIKDALGGEYRIEHGPGWRVEKLIGGKWVAIWYCVDELSAHRRLRRTLEYYHEYSKMTPERQEEERLKVLR